MRRVIADYQSEALDLTDPATFRDLSKPIGALDAKRLSFFKVLPARCGTFLPRPTHDSSAGCTLPDTAGFQQSGHGCRSARLSRGAAKRCACCVCMLCVRRSGSRGCGMIPTACRRSTTAPTTRLQVRCLWPTGVCSCLRVAALLSCHWPGATPVVPVENGRPTCCAVAH